MSKPIGVQLYSLRAELTQDFAGTIQKLAEIGYPVLEGYDSMPLGHGAIASLLMSFDIWQHSLPFIEIYGSQGTLRTPDPNTFGGPVSVWLQSEAEWRPAPLLFAPDVGRGIGVADMVYNLRRGEAHRAQGEVAYHILEVMQSFQQSFDTRTFIQVKSQPDRPPLLPLGLRPDEIG